MPIEQNLMVGAYYSVREHHRLAEVLTRVRAKTHDDEDLALLCEAMERRLQAEEREREWTRDYQRRYRLKKRQR
jgi:hypothetical protein